MSSPISTDRSIDRSFAIFSAGSVTLFSAVVVLVYHFHPTAGAVFLIFGWMALHAAAFFLLAAVRAFDLTPSEESLQVAAGRRVELEREKKLLLKAIKEVEFDRDLGKVDPAEAAAVVGRYRARALEILKMIDADGLKAYEDQIEAELARRLGNVGMPIAQAPAIPAAPAPMPAPTSVSATAEPRTSPTCANCGLANDLDASFCKKCGSKLEVA